MTNGELRRAVRMVLVKAMVVVGITVAPGLVAAEPAPAPQLASAPAPATVSAATATPAQRTWDFAALPLVYYQAETSWGVAGEFMLVRRASSGTTAEARHDTLSASFTATLRRQYALELSGMKYWNQDRDRLKVEVLGERYPNTFWGLGSETPSGAADDYTPIMAGSRINYSHRMIERIFVGVNVLGGYYRLHSFDAGGAVADYLSTRRRQGVVMGVGPTVVRDSRDDSNYPRAGSLTTVNFTAYLPAWFSDYRYAELEMDQRTFITLPWSSVLALQAYGQMIVGEAPIDLLPALGGAAGLRGYFQGRYRDKVYTVGQAEWRVPLFWRLGAAAFGAVGNVYPDVAHISVDKLKAAAGLGLRLNVGGSSPVNIRLDGALARDSTAIYLVVGEAI